jgi:glucose/arabinose dehydrogenase
MTRYIPAMLGIGIIVFLISAARTNQALPIEKIKVPPGFSVSVFATGVNNAREMALGSNGTLFVGSREAGNVYAVVSRDPENRAAEVIMIAYGLNMPSGITFHDGSLYVAEISRVLRFDNIESRLKNPPRPVVVNDKFPTDRQHGWKFIAFGPDGMLYVPIGAPCNICRPDERHGVIDRMKAMALLLKCSPVEFGTRWVLIGIP